MNAPWKSGAQERLRVYQRGQAGFNAGAICPYDDADWRAGTWAKGFAAAKKYHESLLRAPDTVPCDLCGAPTCVRLCIRCAELEAHIGRSPELARRILEALEAT